VCLTCTPGGQPNSLAMGRIATLMQILSMLHSSRASAVGPTILKNDRAAARKMVDRLSAHAYQQVSSFS